MTDGAGGHTLTQDSREAGGNDSLPLSSLASDGRPGRHRSPCSPSSDVKYPSSSSFSSSSSSAGASTSNTSVHYEYGGRDRGGNMSAAAISPSSSLSSSQRDSPIDIDRPVYSSCASSSSSFPTYCATCPLASSSSSSSCSSSFSSLNALNGGVRPTGSDSSGSGRAQPALGEKSHDHEQSHRREKGRERDRESKRTHSGGVLLDLDRSSVSVEEEEKEDENGRGRGRGKRRENVQDVLRAIKTPSPRIRSPCDLSNSSLSSEVGLVLSYILRLFSLSVHADSHSDTPADTI